MARRPRRLAKRPTPGPASRPSAVAPAKAGLPALDRRLEREGPQARSARQRRVRDAVDTAIAKIRERIDSGRELWQAATGEPMPLELEDIRAAACRFGLSPDAALAGDYTLADVTTLMVGKRLAAADALHDRLRVAEAEAAVRRAAGAVTPSTSTPADKQTEAVDDEYSRLARKTKGKPRAALLYLYSRSAFCADTARTRECIAAGLARDGVRVSANTVKNAVASLRAAGRAVGLNVVESLDSGSWLPPDGQRLAALVPKPEAVTTRQAS